MAFVQLHRAHNWALPEIGSGEPELDVGSVTGGEEALVLEASGGASGVAEVAVELVGDCDG